MAVTACLWWENILRRFFWPYVRQPRYWDYQVWFRVLFQVFVALFTSSFLLHGWEDKLIIRGLKYEVFPWSAIPFIIQLCFSGGLVHYPPDRTKESHDRLGFCWRRQRAFYPGVSAIYDGGFTRFFTGGSTVASPHGVIHSVGQWEDILHFEDQPGCSILPGTKPSVLAVFCPMRLSCSK